MAAIPKAIQEPRNPKVQVIGASVLKPLKLKVAHDMDTVILNIDGTELKMDYPSAVRVSMMLRQHAKQAKKFAGDYSKTILAEGVMMDAEERYKKGW